MQREYFCCGCGLFHWLDMDTIESETEGIEPASIKVVQTQNVNVNFLFNQIFKYLR